MSPGVGYAQSPSAYRPYVKLKHYQGLDFMLLLNVV